MTERADGIVARSRRRPAQGVEFTADETEFANGPTAQIHHQASRLPFEHQGGASPTQFFLRPGQAPPPSKSREQMHRMFSSVATASKPERCLSVQGWNG